MRTPMFTRVCAFLMIGAGVIFAANASVDIYRVFEIKKFGAELAEEGEAINFFGFFPGMSRYDAQAMAEFYELDGEDCQVHTKGDKAVGYCGFTMKAVSKILKKNKIKAQTFDEVGQAIANQVGDILGYKQKDNWGRVSTWHERVLLNGCKIIIIDKKEGDGLCVTITSPKIYSQEARETDASKEEREEATKKIIPDLIKSMVDIPVEGSGMKAYKLGKYEVTQAQWAYVMGDNPANHSSSRVGVRHVGECPVDDVTWNDCQEFLKELNSLREVKKAGLVFRLPTEMEWEYACRSGAKEGMGESAAGGCNSDGDMI